MANEINSPWENEIIADDAILYMRVHKSQFDPNGLILPRVFQNRGDGMSTDWNEYSTPEECQRRARKPSENAIIQLPVAGVRKIDGQIVEHTPIYDPLSDPPVFNRAHTDVFGEKTTEVRFHFMKIYSFAIRLENKA